MIYVVLIPMTSYTLMSSMGRRIMKKKRGRERERERKEKRMLD